MTSAGWSSRRRSCLNHSKASLLVVVVEDEDFGGGDRVVEVEGRNRGCGVRRINVMVEWWWS